MMSKIPTQLIVSAKEFDLLSDFVKSNIDDSYQFRKRSQISRSRSVEHDHNAAAFRAATRLYLGTSLSLKGVDALITKLKARRGNPTAGGLGIARHRLALSLASLLFFHRVLYRIFTRLRLQLLHEKVRDIRTRYPRIYAILTSRIAPAVGASFAALSMGIYPASQLRLTITIYALVRAGELLYKAADVYGYLANKPRWVGSWLIFAFAQSQMLHAFVFDRDCFPELYGRIILNNTHEYVQKPPAKASLDAVWPTSTEIAAGISTLANLQWPPFVSPILHPGRADILPPQIDPKLAQITSRAHPALQHLSCALLHPSDPSCFTPYLRQILLSFPGLARFIAIYYSALSIFSIKKFLRQPGPFLNQLAKQILQTSVMLTGSIATAWGSICLFNSLLPRKVMPQSRWYIGGFLAGTWAVFDQGKTGRANALYALRNSLDSLWKVGKKKGWWKAAKGGDLFVCVVSLAVCNWAFDLHRRGKLERDGSFGLVKVLRGDVELGLVYKDESGKEKEKGN